MKFAGKMHDDLIDAVDRAVKEGYVDRDRVAIFGAVEVEYMTKEDEGHGFLNPNNQIDMYHAVERFLAVHLGGRQDRAS